MDLTAALAVGALAFTILVQAVLVGWRFGRLEERLTALDERGTKAASDGIDGRLQRIEQQIIDINDKGCKLAQALHG